MEIKWKSSPNYRSKKSTTQIMMHLLLGLAVVYAFSLVHAAKVGSVYLVNSIVMMVVAVVCSMGTELIYALATKQDVKKFMKSSYGLITPVILVLCCNMDTHPYAVGVAAVIATLFGKLVFGGFGQNVFNPAGVGRAVIITSFSGMKIVDALTGPTPTSTLSGAGWLVKTAGFNTYLQDFGGLGNFFLGMYNGALGETSTLVLIAVAIYLVVVGVIDWVIPAFYIGTIFLGTTLIALINGVGMAYPLAFVSTGAIFFGGIFMLTDPVTNPNTRRGKIVFASTAAVFTVVIRYFANLPEGVVFSILLANMITPVIDKVFLCKQTDNEKKMNIIVPAYVCAMVIAISCCAFGLTLHNKYESLADKAAAAEAAALAYDKSESAKVSAVQKGNAKIVSQDGDTFVVESRFFEGTNKFTIVKENGAIKSLEFTEFDDTPGIGDAAMHKGFIKSFEGATLDSEIDCVAGATYTSKSAIAAARVVLEAE